MYILVVIYRQSAVKCVNKVGEMKKQINQMREGKISDGCALVCLARLLYCLL